MTSTKDVTHSLIARLIAEAFGTFLLVFGIIGTVLFSSSNTGLLGPALAIGLTVVVGVYAFGHISGGHFNPAVTLGAAAAGRLPWRDVLPYIVAQLVGGIISSTLIFAIAAGGPKGYLAAAVKSGFASNGYGDRSPGHFDLISVMLIELILTAVFVYVILGATHRRAPAGFAPLAIGLTLTLIHLISIPVSNTGVNPARSIAAAIYAGPEALGQIWVFILVPVVGGLLAGASYKVLFDRAPLAADVADAEGA